MQCIGIGENLADPVGRAGGDADLGLLQVLDLFGDFEVFCKELSKEEGRVRMGKVEWKGVNVPLRTRPVAWAPFS